MGKVHWYGPPYEYIVDLILDDGQHKYFFTRRKTSFQLHVLPPVPSPLQIWNHDWQSKSSLGPALRELQRDLWIYDGGDLAEVMVCAATIELFAQLPRPRLIRMELAKGDAAQIADSFWQLAIRKKKLKSQVSKVFWFTSYTSDTCLIIIPHKETFPNWQPRQSRTTKIGRQP